MRPFFRPLLTPTLWFIPMFAILCALGVWQIERLHWKLGLIEKIHEGLSAAPVSLEAAYGPLNGAAPSQLDAADYRRVSVHGRFDNAREVLFFTTGEEGAPVYHVLTPFRLDDGQTLLVDRGWIPAMLGDVSAREQGELEGARSIAGILRKPAAPNWFTPLADVAHRIVHTRDPATLAKAFGWARVFPMFLEADATANPGGWPKGGVTVISLPNDHLQYAITWFGLALGLLGVYLVYHHSRGRLGLKKE